MTTSGTNREGVRFIVDVRIMGNMKIFIPMRILSTKSPSLIKCEGIFQFSYEDIHVPFDWYGFEGSIIGNFLLACHGAQIEEIESEDIVHRLDILFLGNSEILGMDVIEPDIFNKQFTV
uniref:Beta C1 protein n=1 Tax=Cotton leaf curl Multan betasatellite TaxID=306025 RepID=H6B959_9VIRU|nr:beta C1 protein [Cotton leaf curl Multan betasatellite]